VVFTFNDVKIHSCKRRFLIWWYYALSKLPYIFCLNKNLELTSWNLQSCDTSLCVSKVGQFREFPQRDLKHILAYCANNKVFVHFQHPLVFGAWDSGIMARHCNNISNAKSHFPSNCFIAQQAVGCVSLTPSHRSAHFSLAHCWQDNSNTGTMPSR